MVFHSTAPPLNETFQCPNHQANTSCGTCAGHPGVHSPAEWPLLLSLHTIYPPLGHSRVALPTEGKLPPCDVSVPSLLQPAFPPRWSHHQTLFPNISNTNQAHPSKKNFDRKISRIVRRCAIIASCCSNKHLQKCQSPEARHHCHR